MDKALCVREPRTSNIILCLTWLIELMILLVQKGKAIEADHLIRYAALAKLVRDRFCDHQNDLQAMPLAHSTLTRAHERRRLTIVGKM